MKNRRRDSGQALIVVITVLAMISIVGLAFFVVSQAERVSSVRHLDSIRAHYIAEAGVAYSHGLLKLDRHTNLIDSLSDINATQSGVWINISDSSGNVAGHFSVSIIDEASKINLNSVDTDTLGRLFSGLGLDASKASGLIASRPFNAIEQIGQLLNNKDFLSVKDYLTVYSRDIEIDLEGKRRAYLNTVSPQVILEALLNSGVNNAQQKAANIKDASDADVAQTVSDRFVIGNITPSGTAQQGSWQRQGDYFEAPEGSGEPGQFVWNNIACEDGEYFCYLYGPANSDTVGIVNNQLIASGDGLPQKVKVTGGSLSLDITPAKNTVSRFSYIELESSGPAQGFQRKVVTGTEALVINELMIKPNQELDSPGLDIPAGESSSYTFSGVRPGFYHIRVFAKRAGAFVGDVSIHGALGAGMHDGDWLSAAVNIDSGGSLTVQIKNNSLSVSSFKGIEISQGPDAEYIEVLNISNDQIDMSNFTFEVYSPEGEPVAGWPGRVPPGTSIGPYQHMVFSVDDNDAEPAPVKLRNDGISFQKIWGFSNAGLIFDEAQDTIDKSFDMLPDKGARVVLMDASGRQVDAVEYQSFQVNDFISLERGDPCSKTDSDGNGFFDGWYNSDAKAGATPAAPNENIGMYTFDETGQKVRHSVSEAVVFNRPLDGFADVARLSNGEPWKKFSAEDLSKIADHIACKAIVLDLAGHFNSGDMEQNNGIFTAAQAGQSGIWEFSDIRPGNYLLSVASDSLDTEGQGIDIAYKTGPQADFNPAYSTVFARGVAFYGRIDLPGDNTCVMQLKITSGAKGKIGFKSITLEPVYSADGRVNVNTAQLPVLMAVFNSEPLAQGVYVKRPVGVTENSKLGIGQLFLLDPAYIQFQDRLTVKSDIYEINSRGEAYKDGRVCAFQIIRTVIDRGS